MANIAIAKIGRSILFDEKKWSAVGGDNEAPFLLYSLAYQYPEHTFWIIGKSDFERVYPNRIPSLPNIKNIWDKEYWLDGVNPNHYYTKYNDVDKLVRYVSNTFKRLDVNIDYAIMMYGIIWTTSLPNNTVKTNAKHPADYVKIMESSLMYSSPLFYFINESKVRWSSIITDPRQIRAGIRDLTNIPEKHLSQHTMVCGKENQLAYFPAGEGHIIDTRVKLTYGYTETLGLLSRYPVKEVQEFDKDWFRQKTGFNMIVNEGIPGKQGDPFSAPRYVELKQYILDNPELDCSIYGKWNEDIMKSDTRFKGTVHPQNLGSVLDKTKYTFCIPIAKGWITSKFLEMAHYGVMPFLHKEYATAVKGLTYIDDYFYVNDIDELKAKIDELENDEHKYFEAVQKFRNALLPNGSMSMYDGSFFAKMLSKEIPDIFNYKQRPSVFARDMNKNTGGMDEFF